MLDIIKDPASFIIKKKTNCKPEIAIITVAGSGGLNI